MKLKSTLILLILLLAFLLSSCNLTQVFPRADVNLALVNGDSLTGTSDIIIQVSIDEETGAATYTIPELRVAGRALPGSIGAHFDSYSIDYFGSDDTPLQTAPDKSYRGVVKLDIRPGIACTSTPLDDCSVNSVDSYPALGELATSTAFSPLDGDILNELFAVPGDYGYADIVLEGKDANGNAYSKLIPHVKITFRGTE
jgi:hypothetical protein